MSSQTETATVVKVILPYLQRRGYTLDDMDFEVKLKNPDNYHTNFSDILVTSGKTKLFLIEAKRSSKSLSDKDKEQALKYARELKVPFVVVTNGQEFRTYHTDMAKPIQWGRKTADGGFKVVENVIPSKEELVAVLPQLRTKKQDNTKTLKIPIAADLGLPFRPGASLSKINSILKNSHNTIRKIEKNEDDAFADFSKLLFLKLLEEKADRGEDALTNPKTGKALYSYRFHELALLGGQADQVSTAVKAMMDIVRADPRYQDVITSNLKMQNDATVFAIVKQLAAVSFLDSEIDSKGAAFEYFVRATLKGKKLGQYFTPRPVVKLMLALYGVEKLYNALFLDKDDRFRIYDPACGTGGFLVYVMQEIIGHIDSQLKDGKLTDDAARQLREKIRQRTLFGSDANAGVASTAKMNMIVAGDGHSNIIHEDSLKVSARNWSIKTPNCDLILSNPPFGTSELKSLTDEDLKQFKRTDVKGQLFFIQKMIASTKPSGEIITVIDEGVLNNNSTSARAIRMLILSKCEVLSVISLPEVTFKPNKINVRSSILHLKVREKEVAPKDLEIKPRTIPMIRLKGLGYLPSGEDERGFDFSGLLAKTIGFIQGSSASDDNDHFTGYRLTEWDIVSDPLQRMDVKYYDPTLLGKLAAISSRAKTVQELNTFQRTVINRKSKQETQERKTIRGKSPAKQLYVDRKDGFAAVIKSGSSIDKFGNISFDGDYITEEIFEKFKEYQLQKGDVLLSSTGDGTLGKCAVYDSDIPAIPDGHITVIRPGRFVDSTYLCDYLRVGLGQQQVERLYTGSTGQIELPPELVDMIVVDLKKGITEQRKYSREVRKVEETYRQQLAVIEQAYREGMQSLS